MRDLFQLFPDLPRPRRQSVLFRVQEVRVRASQNRRRFLAASLATKAQAAQVRAAWRRQPK